MRNLYLLLAGASLLILTSCEERSVSTTAYSDESDIPAAADTIGETYYSPSYYHGDSRRYYADQHSSYHNRYSPLYHQNFTQASRSPLAAQPSYHIVRVVPRVGSKPSTTNKATGTRYNNYRYGAMPTRTYRALSHVSTLHNSPHVTTSHVSTSHGSSGGHH